MHRMLQRIVFVAALAVTPFAVTTPVAAEPPLEAERSDLVTTLRSAEFLSILVEAVREAGLVETLEGPGPWTLFAPRDAAFAALPEGALEALLADPERLRAVLEGHLLTDRASSDDLVDRTSVAPAQGGELALATTVDGSLRVGEARVLQPDIRASNGVVHVIDTVLLP